MKICVYGMWHLGSVTAACLASGGHDVVGLDESPDVVARLRSGRAPVSEPGLDDLIQTGLEAGRLAFATDAASTLRDSEVLWVTWDTPVDEDDRADVEFVTRRIQEVLPLLSQHTLVIVSSQLPVGTIRSIELQSGRPDITFAAAPENLRLGKAIEVFTQPDRVVVGVRNERDRERIAAILAPFTGRIEWMSVESAEMTKHALNAFLATSITFANEVASICEVVGADAKDVERGLKTESRIGPRAYVGPGSAFAGGTLARDIAFLSSLALQKSVRADVITSVKTSNDAHKLWTQRKLEAALGSVAGKGVAVLGLTYKPGTDTLRRSMSVELCRWLVTKGAVVRAHDPAVRSQAADLPSSIALCGTAEEALTGSHAAVIATEWPEFRALTVDDFHLLEQPAVVIDANRFLRESLEGAAGIRYLTIGRGF